MEEGYQRIETAKLSTTARKDMYINGGLLANVAQIILSLLLIKMSDEGRHLSIYAVPYLPLRGALQIIGWLTHFIAIFGCYVKLGDSKPLHRTMLYLDYVTLNILLILGIFSLTFASLQQVFVSGGAAPDLQWLSQIQDETAW
jgi:hypothetical protein